MVPGWCFWRRDRGMPITWRHFVYGLQVMHRAHARESLRLAAAVAIAQAADRQASDRWWTQQRQAAGW